MFFNAQLNNLSISIPWSLRAKLIDVKSKVTDMGGNFIVFATTLVGAILSLICSMFLLKTRLNGVVKTMFVILAVNDIVGFAINTITNGMMLSYGERNRTTCSWFLISAFFF